MDILNFHYDYDYYIPPAVGQAWTPRALQSIIETPVLIEVYPNPANSIVNVVVNSPIPMNENRGTITISDISGRLVEQQVVKYNNQFITIDTRHWHSGFYIYELHLPNRPVQSGKLEIVH